MGIADALVARSRALRRALTWRGALSTLALMCVCCGVLGAVGGWLAAYVEAGGGSEDQKQVLDLRMQGFTGKDVRATFQAYGPAGRRLYGAAECFDFLYMTAYTSFFRSLLTAALVVLRPRAPLLQCLNLLPDTILVADVVENVFILAMLAVYPGRGVEALAPLASAFGQAKWALAKATLAVVAALGAYLMLYAAGLAPAGAGSRSSTPDGAGAGAVQWQQQLDGSTTAAHAGGGPAPPSDVSPKPTQRARRA